MKNFINKKIISIFSYILIGLNIVLPKISSAACKEGVGADGKFVYCSLEPKAFGDTLTTAPNLSSFLSQVFSFGLAIASALAVIMIVWGGVQIMLSDSVFNKEEGKNKIWGAIWGLLLALVSWLILYIINPDILNFKL